MRIFVGTFELKLRSYDIEVACQLPSSLVDFNSVLFTFAPNMALHFVIRHRTRVPISCFDLVQRLFTMVPNRMSIKSGCILCKFFAL